MGCNLGETSVEQLPCLTGMNIPKILRLVGGTETPDLHFADCPGVGLEPWGGVFRALSYFMRQSAEHDGKLIRDQ